MVQLKSKTSCRLQTGYSHRDKSHGISTLKAQCGEVIYSLYAIIAKLNNDVIFYTFHYLRLYVYTQWLIIHPIGYYILCQRANLLEKKKELCVQVSSIKEITINQSIYQSIRKY